MFTLIFLCCFFKELDFQVCLPRQSKTNSILNNNEPLQNDNESNSIISKLLSTVIFIILFLKEN